ncbi:hypothetical protein N0V85_007273 [Neurospora sp. IMI 360204]|nr:hypothetical protein N0V85_007273 [Neurospora sp. IMI 360204]
MFSVLPDLAPRDSHSLWYTSSRNPLASSTSGLLSPFDPSLSLSSSTSPDGLITTNSQTNNTNTITGTGTTSNHAQHNSRNASRNIQAAIIERSLLGRLRADETYMERRKANVSNLGSTWLKPPGVSKTLFQMREEERERQEHEEAMRREEMLARELAEAEAAAVAVAAAGGGNIGAGVGDGNGTTVVEGIDVGNTDTIPGGADGGDMEMTEGGDDMDEMGGRDLDEDIPDADEGGFGYDGASDDDDEEEEQEDEDEEDEGEEEEATTERNTTVGDHGNDDEDTVEAPHPPTATSTGSSILHPRGRNDNNNNNNNNNNSHQQQQQQRELANVRANEERMREMMARGGLRPTHINLADGAADEDDDIDEEDQAHILEEDDIIGTNNHSGEYADEDEGMMDDSLGMNANLDDDIPEADEEHAQSGFYEHTDSEAELLDSSDNEGGQEQLNTGMGIGSSGNGNGGNGGNMSGGHRRVSYGPGSGAGSAQSQHRRVSLPRQQQHQQQRLLRTSLAGSARRSIIGAPRSSLDISGLLSVDESSPMMRSSPRVRRMH